MAASADWLLPEPLSPTMPTHSPGETPKEIPFTAFTIPSGVSKSTFRPVTVKSVMTMTSNGVRPGRKRQQQIPDAEKRRPCWEADAAFFARAISAGVGMGG